MEGIEETSRAMRKVTDRIIIQPIVDTGNKAMQLSSELKEGNENAVRAASKVTDRIFNL